MLSSKHLIEEYSFISSAYANTLQRNESKRSLTKTTKSKGPKLDPCGTPEVETKFLD